MDSNLKQLHESDFNLWVERIKEAKVLEIKVLGCRESKMSKWLDAGGY